ncbi:hypothetical protein Dacet_1533 [Denitrovibrio acetiphilus DSM 12809]|uniref:Uncharacterized protein n=1 Tax=Denitrovibrio acetiphilus (strain DSM 12809 / NBRC 114555 / N2460) TaxID=522772 RepID=D4H8F3_DENA2|nr:hypothetical protein [Denitrovibrio acetiphilus]ADD68302.1 hypothetical protein Dacet_1533 [Denitrovibrio acetiphilus DSM 12809]
MEKTIRCPECGDTVTPEFGMCPECHHQFKRIEYLQQGLSEDEFTEQKGLKVNSALFGKIKVIGFLVVLVFIIFKFFTR